ncbi:MAG: glycosyltransferase family 2 protein, partial [Chitinophagaceae bacterium]
FARLKGFLESSGAIIVMVDDDNILAADYLEQVLAIFSKNSGLGAIGGRSLPLFEQRPPDWIGRYYSSLALRDLGDEVIISTWENTYPTAAPIGAGMGIRKAALERYIAKIQKGLSTITDRNGDSLSSGGDNDIVLEILKAGWQTGYFPQLSLQHIIPAGRTTPEYLSRLVRDSNESWVKLLESHQINPWKKISKHSVPLRKAKAWVRYTAWKSDVHYIEWKGACGYFKGLSEL